MAAPATSDARGLDAVPDTEYDKQGRIIGQGLTLRPTRHRFTVAGQELYTWCALDTLIFPALLGRTAHVASISPASGSTITLTIDPTTGATNLEPANAVVSLANPDQITSIRSSFCSQVHYFTSPGDAAGWLKEHPDAEVLPVAEAQQLAAALAAAGVHILGKTIAEVADAWAPYLTMTEGIRITAKAFTTDVSKLSCCA